MSSDQFFDNPPQLNYVAATDYNHNDNDNNNTNNNGNHYDNNNDINNDNNDDNENNNDNNMIIESYLIKYTHS